MSKRLVSRLAGAIAALAALPAAAITFGSPDGNAHPYVGTLLFERADGFYSCTGTMMSPTVMLTAGHCTEEGGVVNLNTWVSFASNITVSTGCNGDRACLRKYFNNAKNGWIAGTPHPHPLYNDYAQFPQTYDAGIVVLSKAVSFSTYGELPSLNFLNTITPADNSFTAVGYGMQGYIPAFYSDVWARYAGTTKLVELHSTWDGGQSAKYTNNPGTGGGTCYGDSGGPIFYSNTNVVVSVVSWGQTPCIGVDYNFRTDIKTSQDFIDSFLK